MNQEANPLDEYVRQATRLGPEEAALVGDGSVRLALWEEIVDARRVTEARRRRAVKAAWWFVFAAIAAAAIVSVVVGTRTGL